MNEVNAEDLIRELSPDALRYFADLELSDEWPEFASTLKGKFVRLGEVVILGATIEHGPADYRRNRESLSHRILLEHGSHGMGKEMRTRIVATAPKDGPYLDNAWPLVDAGASTITVDQTGQPIGLLLGYRSLDFGQATETVRQQTGEIAQRVLGAEITVTARVPLMPDGS